MQMMKKRIILNYTNMKILNAEQMTNQRLLVKLVNGHFTKKTRTLLCFIIYSNTEFMLCILFLLYRIGSGGNKLFVFVFVLFVADIVDKYLQISPQFFEKIRNGSNDILRGLGETDSWKKPEAKNPGDTFPLTF